MNVNILKTLDGFKIVFQFMSKDFPLHYHIIAAAAFFQRFVVILFRQI